MWAVGCGIGHWGQLLAPYFAKEATVTGIDREPEWVAKAKVRAGSHRFHYQLGNATRLDFADNSFDFVTCQTVLIHLADPVAVLKEFRRVVKPGGLIAVAEPNNLSNAISLSNTDDTVSAADLSEGLRLQLTCERGKRALGLGYNSIGDLLPGVFRQLGLREVQVHLSDKANALLPPYGTDAEQASVGQILEWADREFWIWDREETHRYFLAGGGSEMDFNSLWAIIGRIGGQRAEAIRQKKLHCAGGALTYLVAGRK